MDSSNKKIVFNSVILYIKLFVMTITSFFTTRFALQALGVNDFGLFSVLGSIMAFISIFNNIMISTSNRFISVAIGKGDSADINEQFNINLIIHIALALIALMIAVPIGDWYIYKFINYDGDISAAVNVFHFTVIGSIISFVAVPYNGLLMAKENFLVFSVTDIMTHLFKMIVAFLLIYFWEEKLLIYAFTQGIITAIPLGVYYIYCKKHYADIVKFHLSRNVKRYKDVFSFSGWVAYGAFAFVGKNQASAILVNLFFNTVMNAALGLANTVNSLINGFAKSIAQPIAPQITKNYAAGNYDRCYSLFILSNKLTYFVTLIIAVPFLVDSEWIFNLWLGSVPEYVVMFTNLVIIDTLVISLNSGINNLIFAGGNIRLYQFTVSTIRFLAIGAAYIVLKSGAPAYSLLYTYIVFSIIIFATGQWVLNRTMHFDNRILWRRSYIPSLIVGILLIPCYMFHLGVPSILHIIISELWILSCIYVVGLSKSEKNSLQSLILKRKKQ